MTEAVPANGQSPALFKRDLSPLTASKLARRLEEIKALLEHSATRGDIDRLERRIDKAEHTIIGEIRAQRTR